VVAGGGGGVPLGGGSQGQALWKTKDPQGRKEA
jgi:hypothetical protein